MLPTGQVPCNQELTTGFSHGESLVTFKGNFRGEDAGLTQVVQEKMGEEEHGSNRRGDMGPKEDTGGGGLVVNSRLFRC